MKKIFLSLCFAAFLSAGLVSCDDQAAEVTPMELGTHSNDTGGETETGTKPKP